MNKRAPDTNTTTPAFAHNREEKKAQMLRGDSSKAQYSNTNLSLALPSSPSINIFIQSFAHSLSLPSFVAVFFFIFFLLSHKK